MRLFIAVEAPEGIRKKMGDLARELPEDGLSKVKTENMHFTLKFLGEVREERLGEMLGILRNVAFSPFSVRIEGVGAFPNESHARVVWAGAKSPEMEELARGLHAALAGMFEREEFSAHLTLARVKGRADLKQFLQKHRGEGFGEFRVDRFVLFESRLQPGGPEYRKVAEFPAKE